MKAYVLEDGCPALHRMSGTREVVQHVTRLVDKVVAHDPDRGTIHEIPGVDPVVASDVQLE